MVNTNSTHSVASSRNPTRVQPQPAEEEIASGTSPKVAEPAVQAEAGVAPGPSPTSEAANPEPSPSVPQFSRRVWRSGEPYHPVEPTTNSGDEDHWKKVYGKAGEFDKEFCSGWNSEIDSLLTFAGLFSAVVTAFTIESYKLLQPDPQDMTNRILSNSFVPSSSSLRINVLWFLSLTFSLTAGLVGILCKQWLRHYQQDISKPPREALAFRQFRYDSFLQCRVMDILSALPVLLGLGLILFFVGLIDFLQGLDVKVSIPITILIGVSFAFLVVTTLAPAFQYLATIHYDFSFYWDISRPPLFAFKSPQSLAILHLVTWLFPHYESDLKVLNWTSLELHFFSDNGIIHTYTGHALTWLNKIYSTNLDMVHQIYLCLLDVDSSGGRLVVRGMGEDDLWDFFPMSSSTVIKSFFDTNPLPEGTQEESHGHIRRDIIAIRYLYPFRHSLSFGQTLTVLECLIRVLNSSRHEIPSVQPFVDLFYQLAWEADRHPTLAGQVQEIFWQRAILFRNLLSEGRWIDSTEIHEGVQNVFENLKIFTDGDLDSIFDTLHTWMDQHPQSADLPAHCWACLVSILEPHELDEALRHRPPVRDFMAFLDSRFQMGAGVRYLCKKLYIKQFDRFFKALYAWIEQNPQDTQSFIDCRRFLTTIGSVWLRRARRDHSSFRDFEAFLEAQTAGHNIEVQDPSAIHDAYHPIDPDSGTSAIPEDMV
ncbi:hypothetical protein BD779DRAFT_1694931 [Infundibulicybe gibba]|nr:hypothetical protein BD779DRAFT_1694931 [Infundibulicybe gibba]